MTQRARVVVVNLLPTALAVVAAVALWHAFGLVRGALLLIALAGLLSAALHPVVTWLHARLRVPRALCAILTVAALLALLGVMAWQLLPPLIDQLSRFVSRLPQALGQLEARLDEGLAGLPALKPFLAQNTLVDLGQQVVASGNQILSRAVTYTILLLEGVVSAILVVVLVVYTLARPEPLLRGLLGLVPESSRGRVERVVRRVLDKLGIWGLSTIALMTVVGTLIGLGLWVLGVENALLYGVLAAAGELVPTIGPIFAVLPPVLTAVGDGAGNAVAVVIMVLVVQQLEAHVLAPMILGRSVHLHPTSVLAGILVFGGIFGLLGLFLTVPFLVIIKSVYEVFYLERRAEVPDREVHKALGESG